MKISGATEAKSAQQMSTVMRYSPVFRVWIPPGNKRSLIMWARNIKIGEIELYEEFHWVANSL